MQREPNSFGELLKRYIAGNYSPEEEELVMDWYRSLDGEREQLPLSEEEELAMQHKLWQNIQDRTGSFTIGEQAKGSQAGISPRENKSEENVPRTTVRRGRKWFIYLPWAAAVLLMTFLFLTKKEQLPGKENSRDLAVHEKVNNTGKTILLVLEDESMVWIKPSGSIRYTDFSQNLRREVTLSGEAYFEIAENPEKPFLVYSGNVVTRVTGTKFNVKAYEEDKTVEIEVTEGTVEVSRGRGQTGKNAGKPGGNPQTFTNRTGDLNREADLKLTARQRAVYHTGSRRLEKLTAVASRLERIEKVSEEIFFEFSDTPLRKVVDLLEEAYPVTIELENAALENCPLTASLNDETLDTKLELICRSIGATFSKSPGKIMISGKGCL